MMAHRAAVRLFVLLELALHARATFVVLAKSAAPQCFLFEFPPDTQLTLSYTMPAFAGVRKPESSVTVSLLDRKSKKQVFSRAVANERGSLSFSTVSEEPHDMCLTGTNLADPLRFDFLFEIGQGDGYYEAMATEEHMDKLQLDVVKLNDQLSQILSEADFMKEKEMHFHAKSEHMNHAAQCVRPSARPRFPSGARHRVRTGGGPVSSAPRVMDRLPRARPIAPTICRYWPILQIMILLITGIFQVKHLKQFFTTMRLV